MLCLDEEEPEQSAGSLDNISLYGINPTFDFGLAGCSSIDSDDIEKVVRSSKPG